MGRKIPGAKHHGAKDPMEQKARRDAKIAHKINDKPLAFKGAEAQPLPRKWIEIMKLKEKLLKEEAEGPKEPKTKSGLLSSAKFMTENVVMKGMDIPLKPPPVFNQRPGEPTKLFFDRMDRTCDTMVRERNYEEESKMVNLESEREPLDDKAKKRKKMMAKKGITTKTQEEKRLRMRQRDKARKNKKKGKSGKSEDDQLNFSDFTDKQEFGERVDAPPQLNYKPRKPVNKNKADKVNELLLNKKLNKSNAGGNTVKDRKGDDNKVKKLKKKDDMSMSQKAKLEEERERVIQAYRDIKAKQYVAANKKNED